MKVSEGLPARGKPVRILSYDATCRCVEGEGLTCGIRMPDFMPTHSLMPHRTTQTGREGSEAEGPVCSSLHSTPAVRPFPGYPSPQYYMTYWRKLWKYVAKVVGVAPLGGDLRILSTSGGPSSTKPRTTTCPKNDAPKEPTI